MTTPKKLYEYTGNHAAGELCELLEVNGIEGRIIESTCDRLFVETDDYNDELEVVFGSDIGLVPASAKPRKRGKALNALRLRAIRGASGTDEEIAEAQGYSVSTIRRVRADAVAFDEQHRRLALTNAPAKGQC